MSAHPQSTTPGAGLAAGNPLTARLGPWRRDPVAQRLRAIRLRHLLLMLLRVAAVVLLVLAAARPVVPVSVGGLHAPTALAIVLDHSLSSGAVSGGRRVVDDLAQRARETLRETREGDAVWITGVVHGARQRRS